MRRLNNWSKLTSYFRGRYQGSGKTLYKMGRGIYKSMSDKKKP